MADILLIDDDELIVLSLTRVLEQNGHTVSTAPNGLEGIKILNTQTFDLIITDILMPEMDGIQVIMDTRHNNEKPTSILAISGGGREDAHLYLEYAKTLGANAVLKKPFTNDDLLKAIRQLT